MFSLNRVIFLLLKNRCFKIHTLMHKLNIEGHGFKRTIELNDGHKIPLFGLGLYRCEPTEAEDITSRSLQIGYKLLDTAVYYGYINITIALYTNGVCL